MEIALGGLFLKPESALNIRQVTGCAGWKGLRYAPLLRDRRKDVRPGLKKDTNTETLRSGTGILPPAASSKGIPALSGEDVGMKAFLLSLGALIF